MTAHWKTVTLNNVCAITSNLIDPMCSHFSTLPHVGGANIESSTGRIFDVKTAEEEGLTSGKYTFDGTMVLYSKIRPYLMKVARPDFVGLCSADIYPLAPLANKVDRDFLYHLLLTPNFTRYAESGSARAGMPKVNRSHLFAFEFPLPSLSEQRRIVSVLDAAFAGIATATANTQKNLQNARELFETHRSAVFSRNHSNWVTCSLREAVDEVSTGPFGSLLHKSDYVEGGTPLVNPINIVDGEIKPDTCKAIGDKKLKQLSAYSLQTGDVVIGRRGEIGRCAVVTEQEDGWLCGTGCFFIRTGSGMDPNFLCHLLRSERYRSLLEGQSDRATMPSISNTQLANLPIHCPPLDGQRSINKELHSYWEATVLLANLASRKLTDLDELKQSLLHRAFRGELSGTVSEQSITIAADLDQGPFPFPVPGISTNDLHAGIIALAYYFHECEGTENFFGRVKAEKSAHFAEAYLGIELERAALRDAAGPVDKRKRDEVDDYAREKGYYDFRPEADQFRLYKLEHFEQLKERTIECLGDRYDDLEILLDKITPLSTEEVGLAANTFSAWNNLLLDGVVSPTDQAIVKAAREEWHPRKIDIIPGKFYKALHWLRDEGVVPLGRGRMVMAKGLVVPVRYCRT